MDKRIMRALAEAKRIRQEIAATAQRHDEVAEVRRQSLEGPSPGLMAMLGMLLGLAFFAAGMAFMKIVVG